MTIEEKVSQMVHDAPAIDRLGVPAYNWWNECLHGVARAGVATVFPQAIGLAAMWDVEFMGTIADVLSTEGRAKHHEAVRQGDPGMYRGLTFWTPNINIFRDPRWGRGHETYGEDPYLTARLGVAFVKALQGDDPRYLKLVATPKHFAVHSGPEALRHGFDARVSQRDLRETYLPHFEACVREAKAVTVMGAYTRANGEACCASATLLENILRQEWGFDGYVVSDCGAIEDICKHHKMVGNAEEAAALAVTNGCDLCCGEAFASLKAAVDQGLISEAAIERSVKRLFRARFRLGMFDPPERVPFAQVPYSVNDCAAHRELALQSARESVVLLKNVNGFLPLPKDLKTIAVIGPNANDIDVLLGNYNGTPSKAVNLLAGIMGRVAPSTHVLYARGCGLLGTDAAGIAGAADLASQADVVIACVGLSPRIEGEEGDSMGDRDDIALPAIQEKLLEAVAASGKPLVVVLVSGSAVALNWAHEHANAVLAAWYPGEEGGTAVGEVLFGDTNPGGRLPVTFYKSIQQLPPFEDYRMTGRTYRFLNDAPLYAFGFGLSYTTFAYRDLRLSPETIEAGKSVAAEVTVTNTGTRAGDEVVQLYLTDVEASVPVPLRSLVGFRRLSLQPGESAAVAFTVNAAQMAAFDDHGRTLVEPGEFVLTVGGGQPQAAGNPGRTGNCLEARLHVMA
ncbi:MAG: glycoside hydrolase family 3 protein [Lysobacterales bacterium]|nr:MAG: glycoside hydrolase family 3 protein [Xanthomonadales bacterium]